MTLLVSALSCSAGNQYVSPPSQSRDSSCLQVGYREHQPESLLALLLTKTKNLSKVNTEYFLAGEEGKHTPAPNTKQSVILHISSPPTTREYLSLSHDCLVTKALRDSNCIPNVSFFFPDGISRGATSCSKSLGRPLLVPLTQGIHAHLGGVQGVNGEPNNDTLLVGAGGRKPALFSPPFFTTELK